MWQADHCLLDIWLLDEKGDAKRPWLSVAIDDYSRSIAGYFIDFDYPDTLRTAPCFVRRSGERKTQDGTSVEFLMCFTRITEVITGLNTWSR